MKSCLWVHTVLCSELSRSSGILKNSTCWPLYSWLNSSIWKVSSSLFDPLILILSTVKWKNCCPKYPGKGDCNIFEISPDFLEDHEIGTTYLPDCTTHLVRVLSQGGTLVWSLRAYIYVPLSWWSFVSVQLQYIVKFIVISEQVQTQQFSFQFSVFRLHMLHRVFTISKY